FQRKYSRLDVLINNAGLYTAHRNVTADGLEQTFEVNYLSGFLLTHLLLDLLKKSSPSRIVNVSSRAHEGSTIRFEDLQGEGRDTDLPRYFPRGGRRHREILREQTDSRAVSGGARPGRRASTLRRQRGTRPSLRLRAASRTGTLMAVSFRAARAHGRNARPRDRRRRLHRLASRRTSRRP